MLAESPAAPLRRRKMGMGKVGVGCRLGVGGRGEWRWGG